MVGVGTNKPSHRDFRRKQGGRLTLDGHKLLLEQTRWMMHESVGMMTRSIESKQGGLMICHHLGRRKGHPRELVGIGGLSTQAQIRGTKPRWLRLVCYKFIK